MVSSLLCVWLVQNSLNIIAYEFFIFSSSLFSISALFLVFILHIALKDSFSVSYLIGSSSVNILLIDIYLIKYRITPLRIGSAISLPFKNSLWIFKIRFPFTSVNIAVCRSGPVPCGWIFVSCLLFVLLLMLKFFWLLHPLPLPNIPLLPPGHPPLTFFFYLFLPINSDLYLVKLYYPGFFSIFHLVNYVFLVTLVFLSRLVGFQISCHVDFFFIVFLMFDFSSCWFNLSHLYDFVNCHDLLFAFVEIAIKRFALVDLSYQPYFNPSIISCIVY